MNKLTFLKELFSKLKIIAKEKNNEHILPEHLALYLLNDKELTEHLNNFFNFDFTHIKRKINQFVNLKKVSFSIEPIASFELDIIMKRAYMQFYVSEKKSLSNSDLFQSLLENNDSYCFKLIEKTGVNLEELLKYLKQPSKSETNLSESITNISKILSKYTTNLNETSKNILIGREKEINLIIKSLVRKNKNSVILTGNSGVGKTAIIEGLAQKIVGGIVPEQIKNNNIFSLSMNKLLSGIKLYGVFEERITDLLEELEKIPGAILFIDEMHMIMSAGNSNQNLDFANFLKTFLSNNKVKIIGCTTDEEFRKYIEKDKALIRRFTKVAIEEPTPQYAKTIIKGLIKDYEKFFNITYDKDVINSAVDLSSKYIISKFLPDKALDLIDAASAKCILDKRNNVSKKDIINEISDLTGINIDNIGSSEKDKLSTLKSKLQEKIFGQDNAINTLVDVMYRAKSGLKDPKKPLANLLLSGGTGTGKTASILALSEIFGLKLFRLDMSQFSEKHTISTLIGAPPGYVGYNDNNGGGILINAVEKNPYSIILFDEIEKAHPEIYNILLQIMDHGMLSSNNGKTVSFKNCLICMTSNIGAEIAAKNTIGFGEYNNDYKAEEELKNTFKPEFQSRLDGIINFNKLGKNEYIKIIDKVIADIQKRTSIKLFFTDKVKQHILSKSCKSEKGGRIVDQIINDLIISDLSRELIHKNHKELEINYDNGKVIIGKYIKLENIMEIENENS